MKPRIAVPIPTSRDAAYNARSWEQYAQAVREAGGEPVEGDPAGTASAWRAVAGSCAGVLLPGSPADVAPARYGAERDPATAEADAGREALDFLLLENAWAEGKPVLGVCFGLQAMNVWRGGSLVQDLLPLPVNHAAGAKVAEAHSVAVAEESLLASLVDAGEVEAGAGRLMVNSSHHQAVAVPGDGLRVVARCTQDGVVEAVEAEGRSFFVGVQWHPERSVERSATSRALFARLVDEGRSWLESEIVLRGTI